MRDWIRSKSWVVLVVGGNLLARIGSGRCVIVWREGTGGY